MTQNKSPVLLFDVLSAKPRAQRHLCAQRWEIPISAARVMVERMTSGSGAERIARRIVNAGASNLMPLLVEYGGYPIRRRPGFEAEAAIIRDWQIVVEDRESWRLPLDLAVAMLPVARYESLFLTTLLARLPEAQLVDLREEFELAGAGSRAFQIWRLREKILSGPCDSDAVKQGAKLAAEHGSIEASRIDTVEYIAGSGGCLFAVNIDGNTRALATREVAQAHGFEFSEPNIEGATPEPMFLTELDVPEWTETSGVVSFISIRALQAALERAEFRQMVSEQIGDRRVILSADYTVQDAHLALTMLGYEPNLSD